MLLSRGNESDLADRDDDSVCVRDSRPVDSPDFSPPDAVVVCVSVVAALPELFSSDRPDDSDDDDDDAPLELEDPVPDDDALP